ncbi:MAG: metal ABC transporter substrate-binding protein [Pseudomonadota bacterium]
MYRLSRRSFVAALAALAVAPTVGVTAAGRLKVVATFTVLADLVSNIAGDHVSLTTLVGPNADAHVYEPSPADARRLAEADLVLVNGLGFEGWIDRLIEASGYDGPIMVASEGVAALETAKHQIDPHAWQDLANGRLAVGNIARALSAVDPRHADDYRRYAQRYDRQLAALDLQIRGWFAAIPPNERKVITSHDAFQYFGRAYGIDFLAPVGLSTQDEPSAGEIAALVKQMRKEGIRALFVDNIADRRLMQQLGREASAVIGGTLYSDSLSTAEGPAATYIDMFRHNASEIVRVLQASALRPSR